MNFRKRAKLGWRRPHPPVEFSLYTEVDGVLRVGKMCCVAAGLEQHLPPPLHRAAWQVGQGAFGLEKKALIEICCRTFGFAKRFPFCPVFIFTVFKAEKKSIETVHRHARQIK